MIDLEGGYGEMWSRSWSYFNCGHRDDAVMRRHRQRHAARIMASPQTVTVPETVGSSWESSPLSRWQPDEPGDPLSGRGKDTKIMAAIILIIEDHT